MPKDMDKARLFDFYGSLLSEHQRDFFDLYYNEDLSLGEIAENAGITRQAVLGNIRKAENNLILFEKGLGLLEKHEKNLKILDGIKSILRGSDLDQKDRLLKLLDDLSI